MLARYLDTAMEMATYEIVEDDGSYWGEIPGYQGVWAKDAAADDIDGLRADRRRRQQDQSERRRKTAKKWVMSHVGL